MNSLVKYGVKSATEGPILSGQAKPPSDPTTPSVADFFPKVPKPTQEAMSDPVEPSDSTPQPSPPTTAPPPPTTAPPPPPLPTPLPTPLPAASTSQAPDFTPSPQSTGSVKPKGKSASNPQKGKQPATDNDDNNNY